MKYCFVISYVKSILTRKLRWKDIFYFNNYLYCFSNCLLLSLQFLYLFRISTFVKLQINTFFSSSADHDFWFDVFETRVTDTLALWNSGQLKFLQSSEKVKIHNTTYRNSYYIRNSKSNQMYNEKLSLKKFERGSERQISLLRQAIVFTTSKVSFQFITTSKITVFLVHHYYENQNIENNEKNIKSLSFV